MTRHVQQEDPQGCGVACLAMVTGEDYRALRDEIDAMCVGELGKPHDWLKGGITHYELDRVLNPRGWWMQRTFKAWHSADSWPVEPWAPMHIVCVKQPSGNSHYVVMERDGAVFDPMDASPVVRSLADWPGVNNITGLVKREWLRGCDAEVIGLLA